MLSESEWRQPLVVWAGICTAVAFISALFGLAVTLRLFMGAALISLTFHAAIKEWRQA